MKIKIRWTSKSKLRILTCLALSMIILFYLINNIYFIINDKIFPDGTIGLIYRSTLDVYKHIQNFEFKKAFLCNNYYPPLFNFVSVPFLLMFGKHPNNANLANLIFFVILVLSVYGISKEYKNSSAGFFTILILLSFPRIISFSRTYTLDFALTAMVCLSIYFLIKAKNFTKRNETIFFGLTLALGMLTKWTFICFVIGPMIYIILSDLTRKNGRKIVTNAIISISIGIAISSVWYFGKLAGILHKVLSVSGISGGNSSILNPNSLAFIKSYIEILALQQIYPFFFIFVPCMIYIILFKREYMLFAVWFTTPLFMFSLFQSNFVSPRYILPYLPSIAIIISLSIFDIKKVVLRRTSIMMLSILAVTLFLLFSYSASFGKNLVSYTSNGRTQQGYLKMPKEVDKIMGKLNFIESCDRPINISIITDYGKVGLEKVHLSIIEDFPDCNIVNIFHPIGLCAGGYGCPFSKKDYIDMFMSSDYVIDDNYYKPGHSNWHIYRLTYEHHMLQKSTFDELKTNFKLVNQINGGNNYSVYIYQKY